MTQSLHGRDAQQLVGHVRVYQDALIRHQRENPQDGVEDWFPAQCPATHAQLGPVDRIGVRWPRAPR